MLQIEFAITILLKINETLSLLDQIMKKGSDMLLKK